MSPENKELAWTLTKIGIVGTIISIPVGIWAIKRWPDETWKTAVLLTALSFAVKEKMLHGGGEHA